MKISRVIPGLPGKYEKMGFFMKKIYERIFSYNKSKISNIKD